MDNMLSRVKSTMDQWFMMTNMYYGIAIALLYLTFVKKFGPNLMKDRKPFDLNRVIIFYNAVQVAFSSWWLYKMTTNWSAMAYIGSSIFQPGTFKIDEKIEHQIDEMVYYYLLSKYVELLDTVFFILRQKWNQVTFLHVYHHSNMAVVTWFYLKYMWGRHIIVLPIINVFIHVLMYSYYLLSAIPAIRPYLWWKKYITRMQLGQFVIILMYVATLIYNGCSVQKSFLIITALNTTSFLVLFLNFYSKTYRKRPDSDAKTNASKVK